ncbi:MAG: energy transducer TonB [Sulfuricaulis sp.]|uniref:energy transducer TonB n=1 Tax=Sulfuricaulis sp. TaxID=2003553 RepID=UPI003C4E036B
MTPNLTASLREMPPATLTAFAVSIAAHMSVLLWFGPGSLHAPQLAAFKPIEVALIGEAAPTSSLKPIAMPKISHNPVSQAAAPKTEQHSTTAPDTALAPAAKSSEEPLVKSRYDVRSLNNPKPPYPFAARRNSMEGSVVLRAYVLEDGHCAEVKLMTSSGHDLLDNSALQTVKQWRFVPATRGGVAVASWVEIPITFRLQDTSSL